MSEAVGEKSRASKGTSRSSRQLRISYVETGVDEYSSSNKPAKEGRSGRRSGIARTKVYPEGARAMVDRDGGVTDGTKKRRNKKNGLRVNTSRNGDVEKKGGLTPATESSSPRTPGTVRGSKDLRSPGHKKSPRATKGVVQVQAIPDFITQTDANGNATTPRSEEAIQGARVRHPSGPKPRLHVRRDGRLTEDDNDDPGLDPCETIIDGLRLMCCCLLPDGDEKGGRIREGATQDSDDRIDRVRLLGPHHPDDEGKKCLVLDLDETLVHSSFRAVPGADFVIPVQVKKMN